ncbi:hypothetical protein P879_00125 [Paragonimus westermani]|uniref:Protein unc-79 homolog n=1 Tax=Paragonimus westermani TaxID=34504 RepID=A0A8T0DPY0_9TREM|nr:hypothetical protein P879_00125 [Paragonimus westermani]
MELMCSVVIPLIYNAKDDQESYAIDSIPAILTLIFQHVEKIEYHVWILESFLSKKKELHKDLLMIVAYGPTEARLPAVCLLFHYWPEMYPASFYQNQTLQPLHYVWEPWKPLTCDRTDCPNKAGKALAMKMTVNPRIAAQHGGKPPPFYVCLDCADALNRRDFDQLVDILLPSKQISLTCESKTCRSKNNQASVTCWSTGCTFLTGNRAIRFCDACHTLRHSYGQTGREVGQSNEGKSVSSTISAALGTKSHGQHIFQMQVPDVWDMALDLQSSMVEAIVSLSRETMPRWRQVLLGGGNTGTDGLEETTPRAVAGLTCTGPNPPGGPSAGGGDMIMLGVTSQSAANTLSLVGGPASGLVGPPGVGTGVLGVSAGNLSLSPCQPHAEFGSAQSASGLSIRGIAGVPVTGVNANTEVGELSLVGRYSDEDHKVVAIYGALLVGEKCRPRECLNVELLTRITAGIFNWFLDTIYTSEASSTYDGRGTLRQRYELGDLLERVKSEYILKWIQEVHRLHPEAIFAVLLPHPLEYARVGSCWDALCDRTTQVKHGLSRLGSLIPYDIVTFEKVYHFVVERFINTPVAVQDQALAWLEILTSVEVPIPMKELLTMFRNGVESFQTELLTPEKCNLGEDSDSINFVGRARSASVFRRCESPEKRKRSPQDKEHVNDLHSATIQLEITDTDIIGKQAKSRVINSPAQTDEEEQTPDETKGLLSGKTHTSSRKARKHVLRKRIGTRNKSRPTEGMGDSVKNCVVVPERRPQSEPTRPIEKSRREPAHHRRRRSVSKEYRITDCLAQMLNIAFRQLKIHDPLGHAGYTQETPQLLLSLLGDMLQLYWRHHDEFPQSGSHNLQCAGLETCIFPNPQNQPQLPLNSKDAPANQKNECLNCLDMLTWLNYVDLICQHFAPLRPSLKTTVEFTAEALTKAAEFPVYRSWREPDYVIPSVNNEELISSETTQPPSLSELSSMPPVVRVVYLLVRFLRNESSCSVPKEVTSPDANGEPLVSTQKETRSCKDPIVLQCVLECLIYLCHIGDCLHNALVRAEKGMPSISPGTASGTGGATISGPGTNTTALASSGTSGQWGSSVSSSSKGSGWPKSSPTGVGSQNPGGTGYGFCSASPKTQANFVHYLVHSHLIPSLWGLLRSEFSHLASWIVPLLLHCVLFPGGSKVFWNLIETDFGHGDWRVRFNAIEKVTVLLRELDHQVLGRGFSGAAGTKITSILSGGSMASASGVNLFGRSAVSNVVTARSRLGVVGRSAPGKTGAGLGRSHAVLVASAEGKPVATNENPLIHTALAHAFCSLIGSLNDANSTIAQYAATQLASLNNTALMCGIQCLEFQFDTVAADRCLILQSMHQLSCTLPDRQVFTWDFFVNRFGLLALQAQMSASGVQDMDTVTDLNGYHKNSQHFQIQFERACFVVSKSSGLPSIRQSSKVHNLSNRLFAITSGSHNQSSSAPSMSAGSQSEAVDSKHSKISSFKQSNTGSVEHSSRVETGAENGTPVRSPTPQFHSSRRSRMSMASFSGLFPAVLTGGEFLDGSNKFLSNIRNALDQDSQERDTLHQWVRLLLKFMANVRFDSRLDDSANSGPASNAGGGRHHSNETSKDELRDRKALSKAQRHLAFLLGYSDGVFTMPPYKMRNSTVFHSFLAHVGSVLDRNFSMGTYILHQTLVVLQFCASPQRYATDSQPPTFTLRLLEPHVRWYWLQTLLVILYKYEYNVPGGSSSTGGSGPTGGISTSYTTGSINHASSGPLGYSGGIGAGASSTGHVRLRKHSSEPRLLDPDEPHRTPAGANVSAALIGQSGPGPNLGPSGGAGGSGVGIATSTMFASGHHHFAGPTSTANLPSGGTRGLVEYLIQIVLNTLDAHVHVCREQLDEEPFDPPSPPLRLREASNVSADFTTIVETDTPPASPTTLEQHTEDEVVMPGVTVTLICPEQEARQRENEGSKAEQGKPRNECLLEIRRSYETKRECVPLLKGTADSSAASDSLNSPYSTCVNSSGKLTAAKEGMHISEVPSQTSRILNRRRMTENSPSVTHFGGTASSRDTRLKPIGRLFQEVVESSAGDTMDSAMQLSPTTVSRDEQAIDAPILTDGMEMAVLKERKTSPTECQTNTMLAVSDFTPDGKTGRKVALRFQKKQSAERSVDRLKREDYGQAQAVISPDVSAEITTSKPPRIKYLSEQPKHSMSTDVVTDSPGRLSHLLRESESRSKLSSGGAGQAEITSHKTDRKKVTPSKKSSVPQSQTDVSRSGSTSNVALTSAAATAALTTERCPWCHQILERYDESTLGLGMLCLATFVHREPGLAAPYLRDMLLTAARLANTTLYSWQSNQTHIIVPGNVSSIARQFLRCTMYNLAPNGLFPQLFQTPISDDQFFKCIISVLVDFEDHMSFFQPVLMLLEAMNKRKTLPTDTLPVLLENLANYLEYLPNLTDDVKVNHFIASGWTDVIGPLEVFLRKLAISVPVPSNLATTVRIMTYILRSPVVSNFKTLPDTFSAILRLIVENVHFRLSNVIELCSLSNRVLKERTKIQLSKTLIELFHQAIKFRASIPDENLIKLLQFILMDAGGTMEPNQVVEGLTTLFNPQTCHLFSTGAAELMRPHLADCIAFISDVHTMHKVKQSQKTAVQLNLNGCNMNGGSTSGNAFTGVGNVNLSNNFGSTNGLLNSNAGVSGHNQHTSSAAGGGGASGGFGGTIGVTASIPSLHEDVLGAHLKSGLAQYVSLELSRSSSCSDQDVLTVLAPGLLVDVRPVKTTGFAVSSRGGQRLKPPAMCTNPSGPILSPGATATSGQGTELHSTKSTRSSGSLTSRQSDDIGGDKTHRGTNRTGDQTVIVITPSADTTSTDLPTTAEPGTSRTQGSAFFSNNNADSQGLSALTPATSGQSLHPDSSSTHSPAISNSSSLTVPPGAPGGNSPRLGHITLAPTFSQSSQIDAPVLHLLPWLKFTPPSSQLGPRDFLVMVERVRTLSWLLLGATMNMALTREATGLACRPIPFMLVRAVADLVKALLSSFPDQQKQSVTVMSSLYHAFLLCQVWTVYCEAAASLSPSHCTQHKVAIATAVDFWRRIMPTILSLLSISDDFIIVSGRLLSVIEELVECQCSVVTKLFPIWIPMLCGRYRQLPGNMSKRLQKCIEWEPPEPYTRLLLLLSLPETSPRNRTGGDTKRGGGQNDSSERTQALNTTTPTLPGLTASSLLACQANTLMGCSPLMKTSKGPPEEGIPITGGVQCAGHALASSAPYSNDGVGTGVGIGAGALGADLLTSRLVAWLKKHIFVLGRNEDQHSTATHIFVH